MKKYLPLLSFLIFFSCDDEATVDGKKIQGSCTETPIGADSTFTSCVEYAALTSSNQSKAKNECEAAKSEVLDTSWALAPCSSEFKKLPACKFNKEGVGSAIVYSKMWENGCASGGTKI